MPVNNDLTASYASSQPNKSKGRNAWRVLESRVSDPSYALSGRPTWTMMNSGGEDIVNIRV